MLAGDESVDEVIGRIADSQRGCVSRAQLLSAGLASATIGRRLRAGRLVQVHRGVYALPHTAEIPLHTETAALLACGEGAVLSHHSAATLWQLRPGQARPVHVTIPAHRGFPAPAGVRLHRSRILIPADIRIHCGLPVTSPARTLLDIAATLPDRDVERLLYEALFARRLVTLPEINGLLRRAGGHPGRRRLTRVAGTDVRFTSTDSRPAEKLHAMMRSAGLPEPLTQVWLLDYCLDFYWPDLKLAVEVDAYGTHARRRASRAIACATPGCWPSWGWW